MMVTRFSLLFYTVRHLRLVQIYSRIKYKLYRPLVNNSAPPAIRDVNGYWNEPIPHTSSLLNRWEFSFLNEEHSLKSADDWDNPKFPKLWRYNLHYFDDLNAINASSRNDWHNELIPKWLYENPPALGSGWESYPTSLRIINWIKWSLSGNKLSQESVHSLAIQIRWLSKHLEFHILGNHLFANAKALVFSGLFFEGPEAEEWLETGLNILKREVPEQILKDGGHFERSPMYHAIILEDLLDLRNVTCVFPELVAEDKIAKWTEVITKMSYWLRSMLHPDGQIGFFNDSVFSIGATYAELESYAKRLGINSESKIDSLTHLQDSGYVRIESGSAVGLIDVAPIGPDYLPGHAHADTLSFELSLFGQRVFVNSGISQYGNDPIRQYQRSTVSHNTVSIDGCDSSEVWAGFRVARRAYPRNLNIINNENDIRVSCEHNGYLRLPGKNIHNREWVFERDGLCITDKIMGTFDLAIARFYLHPDITIAASDEINNIFNLTLSSGEVLQLSVKKSDKVEIISSNWFPEFGMKLINKCVLVHFSSPEIIVSMVWK
ncbi:MAG: putative heparinase superfamily protein [Oleiphilaceae bacterium]|jgi:uncharacterized heparinase superfamily protein